MCRDYSDANPTVGNSSGSVNGRDCFDIRRRCLEARTVGEIIDHVPQFIEPGIRFHLLIPLKNLTIGNVTEIPLEDAIWSFPANYSTHVVRTPPAPSGD